jgi:glycosyltransferase involved in cell wall biosynthesis
MWLNDLNAANPDAIYILWCYHEHVDRIPFRRWILTGEHYFQPPTLSTHKPIHALNKKLPNFVPLLLRVNESPVNIGQDQEGSRKYLGCFMGSPYKREWIQGIPGVFYHSIYDGFLSSAERASIHRESVFGFGFHSDDNVKNNHVTQRVFEAMAYGCVVLSDNPAATAMTGGIVENVRSPDELRTKIQYFLQNPEIIAAKRTAGYDWCRQWGTNRYAAQCFLDKIKVLWG